MTGKRSSSDSKLHGFRISADDTFLLNELRSKQKRPDGYIKRLVLLGLLAEKGGFDIAGDGSSPRLAWPAVLVDALNSGQRPPASPPMPVQPVVVPQASPQPAVPAVVAKQAETQPPQPLEEGALLAALGDPEVLANLDMALLGL